MFVRIHNDVSHDIGSSVCARHLIHVSCAWVFDLSSTLASHSASVSPIFHLFFLNLDWLLPFPLPCGCLRSKIPCALRPLRSLALWPITPLSHLEDSKSTSGGVLCIFGSRMFIPISWMRKKQTSVSHCSTESESISLDAGLRMDGLLALDLCDVIIQVLHSTTNTARPSRLAQGNLYGTGDHSINKTKTKTPTEKSKRDVDQLSTVDYVPCLGKMYHNRDAFLRWEGLME